jgi:hypothetical protein
MIALAVQFGAGATDDEDSEVAGLSPAVAQGGSAFRLDASGTR